MSTIKRTGEVVEKEVRVKKRVYLIEPINLSARDWQLFTNHKVKEVVTEPHPYERDENGDPVMRKRTVWETDPEGEKTIRSERAAQIINGAFTEAVNRGYDPESVFNAVYNVMGKMTGTGATDTEPRNVLLDLIDECFGSGATSFY